MILRELLPADAAAVQRIYSRRSVVYLGRAEMTAQEATDYIGQCLAWHSQNPQVRHILGIDVDGDLVGLLKLATATAEGRLSYILREDTWGRGYATTAVRRLLPNAFGLVGLVSVGAKHLLGNPASGRVLTKAGFTKLGEWDGFAHYLVRREDILAR